MSDYEKNRRTLKRPRASIWNVVVLFGAFAAIGLGIAIIQGDHSDKVRPATGTAVAMGSVSGQDSPQ